MARKAAIPKPPAPADAYEVSTLGLHLAEKYPFGDKGPKLGFCG
jgi:hypothetical protein